MKSSLRTAIVLGTVTAALLGVTFTSVQTDMRAQAGGWSFWEWITGGSKSSSSAAAVASVKCDAGLRCGSASVDPATLCGSGKTPVFADPVTLRAYGACSDAGKAGQCHACVLVYTPRVVSSSSTTSRSSVSSSTSGFTSVPPADGYVCRGISGSDAGVPIDCASLGMLGTRCPDGSTMVWYGQVDPAKSGCELSPTCKGRWGKCVASSSVSSKTSSSVSSVSSSVRPGCGDGVCSEDDARIVCIDPPAPPRVPDPNTRYGCYAMCEQDCRKTSSSSSTSSTKNACGDGVCSEIENAIVCPSCPFGSTSANCSCHHVCAADCGTVESSSSSVSSTLPGCGDGVCAVTRSENAVSCPQDCKTSAPRCGDGICQRWIERSSAEQRPDGCIPDPVTGKPRAWCPDVCDADCGTTRSSSTSSSVSSTSSNPKNCPMPSCAMPGPGCSYVANREKNADGCPAWPCGKLTCGSSSSMTSSVSAETVCLSSFSYDANMRPVVGRFNCPLEQHCSTEDGVCNKSPGCTGDFCPQVCAGTCVSGRSKLLLP